MSEKEILVAEKLIKFGFAKGSLALEMVVQSPVVLKQIELTLPNFKGVTQYSNKNEGKSHLLKTELVGDLKGFCHLLFSDEDVTKIQYKCLPQELVSENNSQSRLMKLEFMTELDNMVAGAVVTELANFLELEMYGNVPSLNIMNASEVNEYIGGEVEAASARNAVRGILHIPELNVFVEFIWLFQDRIVELVKEFSKSEKSREIVEL
ncbi:MAG: hypothetical protein JXR07_06060 [Reichenbachiella sp.]